MTVRSPGVLFGSLFGDVVAVDKNLVAECCVVGVGPGDSLVDGYAAGRFDIDRRFV